ncbi:MAG: glycosyltransferase [Muribaculaceae bacterium]|nr:glycosyltransferase [Muribaculaceae bacterium]
MDTLCKVTFVIPAYNVERFLPIAVKSVIAQTEENWEMIIVDDCSTDRTLAIAEDFAMRDPRIRVIRMGKQSGGAYLPRKRGIMEASTKYVAPLDADDCVGTDYLEQLLKGIEENDSDIIYPVMYSFDGKSAWLENIPEPSLIGKTIDGPDAVKYTLDGWRIHCNGGIIRKSLYVNTFEMVNESKVNIKSYLDEYLTRILLYNARKVTLTEVKYYYRKNEESITHSTDIRAFGLTENNLNLLTLIKAFYAPDSEEYLLIQRQLFHGIFDTIRLLRRAELNEEEKQMVDDWLEVSREKVDKKLLKGKVSPRYLWLLKFSPGMSETFLRIVDTFHPPKSEE